MSGLEPTPESLGPLVREIRKSHHRHGEGCHGVAHWARVLENGLRLAERTGASVRVVTYFAVFHDACRRNDYGDPGHGRRGADLARSIGAASLGVSAAELDLLCEACAGHTGGRRAADVTVGTCWDADRLDLPRVGEPVQPARLCTPAAQDPEVMAWARERALDDRVPPWASEWMGA